MDKKHFVINKIISIGFFGYFTVLLIERIIALILSPTVTGVYSFSSGDFFPIFAYVVTIASILLSVIVFYRQYFGIIKVLFTKKPYDLESNYKPLILGACLLLVSGMMYTGFTLSWLQFIAYGFLIAAMITKTVEMCLDKKDKFYSIISVIYLTCFSMCIPVCHISTQAVPFNIIYYVFEIAAVAILIPIFYLFLMNFFVKEKSVFNIYYFALMLVLSGLVIGFQWKESINYFVLGSVGATFVTYLTAIIGFKIKNK